MQKYLDLLHSKSRKCRSAFSYALTINDCLQKYHGTVSSVYNKINLFQNVGSAAQHIQCQLSGMFMTSITDNREIRLTRNVALCCRPLDNNLQISDRRVCYMGFPPSILDK